MRSCRTGKKLANVRNRGKIIGKAQDRPGRRPSGRSARKGLEIPNQSLQLTCGHGAHKQLSLPFGEGIQVKRPITIELASDHQVTVRVRGLSGSIRYWVPEAINTAWPGFDPPGVCMLHYPDTMRGSDRVDVIPLLRKNISGKDAALPPVCTRGPETQLKLETPDEISRWQEVSDTELKLEISKPAVFRYVQHVQALNDAIVIEGQLHNDSPWDWRDAYVYFCCGVDPCPALTDCRGERTFLVTAQGFARASDLRKRVWANFRPTAQYYEVEGRPMPRTSDGFAFDECGISPDRVVAGMVLRQAMEGDLVLAVVSRRFRSTFMVLSEGYNCLHANPSAGDVLAGQVSEVKGSIYLLHGRVEDVAAEIAEREGIRLPPV